jgi:hypothetical protein
MHAVVTATATVALAAAILIAVWYPKTTPASTQEPTRDSSAP